MIKRSSSRTSRSRGIKGKHVLQICLLVGVCFWLIYQVKHSHEKKKEFENSESVSSRAQTHDGILKLGRKDLHPRERESALSDKQEEEEEDETGVEEEVNKEDEKQKGEAKQDEEEEREEEEVTKNEEEEREEEEVTKNEEEETEEEENTHDEEERDKLDEKYREEENEEETKGGEAEDESGGDGDDESGEKNQEKVRGQINGEEDSVDLMNERELVGGEKEGVDKEGEDKIGEVERKTLTDEQEQYDSGKNSHEAREEHYKADDASSAVTHEPEKTSENLIEKVTSELEQENNSTSNNPVHSNNSTSQLLGQRLTGNAPPVTNSELKDGDIIGSNLEDKLANAAFTSLTGNQPEQPNKSIEVSVDASNNANVGSVESTSGSSQQNDTVTFSHLNQAENGTTNGATTGEVQNLQANDSGQVQSGTISDSNQANSGISTNTTSTIPSFESNNTTDGDTSKSSSNSDITDKTSNPEITAEAQVNTGSVSMAEEVKDDSHNENSNTDNESGGTDESSGYSTTDGTGDSVTHDPIDSSDSSLGQDEREARIDLSTLPETGTDVITSGNVGAE